MAEETIQQTQETAQEQTNAQPSSLSERLAQQMWGNANVTALQQNTQAQQPQEQIPEQKQNEITETKPKDEEEVLDINDWLKREFEFDDVDKFKQTYNELKKLKETPQKAAEIKFDNDTSKLIYDNLQAKEFKKVRQFLETQEKLDAVLGSEVNKNNADDIIKLGMQIKYSDLTQSEIDYKFNKQYAIPKEPKQTDTETDEEFAERKALWKDQVNDIEMTKLIDAKLARPDLQKSKSELVLPDITRKEDVNATPQISQEDLAALEEVKTSFLKNSENLLNDFKGISANVKNNDVDYNVTYTPSKEEKEVLNGMVKQFADSGLDANSLFAQRWVNDDNTINTNQMVKDLTNMLMADNAKNKIANESANQRLELYLKGKKNINLDNSPRGNVQLNETPLSERLAQQFFGVPTS